MKNLQKGFLTTLLSMIITLLVIGGGYYVYNQKKNIKNLESEKKTIEDKVVATTKVLNSSNNPKVIKCNPGTYDQDFFKNQKPCVSDMTSIDEERENKVIDILARAQRIDLKTPKYLHGELLISDKQYNLISIPTGPKYHYIVVDILNNKITDDINLRGYEIITRNDDRIVFGEGPIKQYIYGTAKTIDILNTDPSPYTYISGEDDMGGLIIGVLATSTNSITLGLYDLKNYNKIGTKVIDLTK